MIPHFFTAPLPLFSRAFVSDAHLDPILVHRPSGRADALPGQGITDSLVTERFPLVFFFDYFPDQFLEFFLGHRPRRLGNRLSHQEAPCWKASPAAGNDLMLEGPAHRRNGQPCLFCQISQFQRLPVSGSQPEERFLMAHQSLEHQQQGLLPFFQHLLELPGFSQLLLQVGFYLPIPLLSGLVQIFLVQDEFPSPGIVHRDLQPCSSIFHPGILPLVHHWSGFRKPGSRLGI